jgi:hypothetical protein
MTYSLQMTYGITTRDTISDEINDENPLAFPLPYRTPRRPSADPPTAHTDTRDTPRHRHETEKKFKSSDPTLQYRIPGVQVSHPNRSMRKKRKILWSGKRLFDVRVLLFSSRSPQCAARSVPPHASSAMSVDTESADFRTALKQVFDKFDADGSGSVSTQEMTNMVQLLKMDVSGPQIRKMMVEADHDMSGEIDFEEFMSVVKRQIAKGGAGGIASVVSQAGGFFGFFGNIFGSFFGGGEEPKVAPPPPKPKARAASPPTSPTPTGSPPPPPEPMASPVSPEVVSGGASGGGGSVAFSQSDNLFEKYMSPSQKRESRALGGGGQTRTTRLRARGVRMAVYLNGEVDRGTAAYVSLPEECDTLGEVMPLIQRTMKLHERMKFAHQLFLPDGTLIETYQQLIDAAALETAIIVACGEPFDKTAIPFDILEFHLQGGGRQAADKVKKMLQNKKLDDAYDRAERVRASGHGTDSRAVTTSRELFQEENREQAMLQRQEYVEQLMYAESPPCPRTAAEPKPSLMLCARATTVRRGQPSGRAPTDYPPPPPNPLRPRPPHRQVPRCAAAESYGARAQQQRVAQDGDGRVESEARRV